VLPRVLETEAMDTLDEAVDYDAMDHAEVNRAFVDDLLTAVGREEAPLAGVLDLGTGTALIPIELCRRHSAVRVTAKRLPYCDGQFPTVVSNSIVHHVPEPREVLDEAWRVTAPGGLLFFRDLFRPPDEATLRNLVHTYAEGANEHQKQMFADSFRAALTVDEMQELVARYGQPPETVRMTSDRHWTWVARKS